MVAKISRLSITDLAGKTVVIKLVVVRVVTTAVTAPDCSITTSTAVVTVVFLLVT